MKANELRIGNKVWFNDIFEWTITADDIVAFESDSEQFKPINLTEEWLVRFGFERVEGNQWYNFYKLDNFKILIHTKDYSSMINWKDCSIEDRFNWNVHQLQNLYFALTGEELTINNN